MNKYYLKVMHPGGTTYDDVIYANYYDYKDAGCFVFYKIDDELNKYAVAAYPIALTIIRSIERDVIE